MNTTRIQFEQWAASEVFIRMSIFRDKEGNYCDDSTDLAWGAWQAASKELTAVTEQLKEAREEIENLRHEYHGTKAMAEGFKDKIKTVTEQRDRPASQLTETRTHLLNIKYNAIGILNIKYGDDGDCGADSLAQLIDDDCEKALQTLNQPTPTPEPTI